MGDGPRMLARGLRLRLHHPSSADTNAGADNANQRNDAGETVIESHYQFNVTQGWPSR